MKIVQMIFSLSSGGAEKFVVNLSNEMAGMGHEVCVCILRPLEERYSFLCQFLNENVRFVSLNIPAGFSPRQIPIVERFLDSYNPDIVNCHLNVIPFVFKYSKTNRNIHFFHTLHSVAENACGSIKQIPINKYFYKKRNFTPITISPICCKSFEKLYGITPDVIENGSPSVKPSADFESVQNEVAAIVAETDVKVFVHVARYDIQKNQELLIDSFNHLSDQGVDFRLLVIGRGFDSDEAACLRNKACSKIHFLGEKTNVGDYLLCSDAFCLTSIYEGLPISLLEAMSCGLTPICTPVGGIPDIIQDKETGYLSRGMDVNSYADCILSYLDKPLDCEEIKQAYFRKFSMSLCAEKYLSLYKKAIFSSVISIGPDYIPVEGGIAQVIKTYSEYIISPFNYISNSCSGRKLSKMWRALSAMFRLLFKLAFDGKIRIVHIHTASNNSFWRSTIFMSIARVFRCKVVLHIHGGGFKEFADGRVKIIGSVLKKCNAVVALSDSWKSYLETTFSIANVFVLKNPVPVPMKVDCDKNNGIVTFVFLGSVNENKGVWDIVDMCVEHYSDLKGKVVIKIAGSGEVQKLVGLIDHNSISDVLEYFGWADEQKKQTLLNQGDVFLLPSYMEGVPISILEAESYGMPIIATRVGGIPSIVNENNGILINPGDKDALFESIIRISSDRFLRESMGKFSTEIVSDYYPEKISDSLVDLYSFIV